jgi:hypothetical protein
VKALSSMRAKRRMAVVLALALLAALPALAVLAARVRGPFGLCLSADWAITELMVRHALELDQALGPYSRFRWNHPGPMLFYVTAPIYAAFGRDAVGLNAAAALVNALVAVCAVWALYRARAEAGAFAAALVFLVTLGALNLRIESIWGPHVVIAPLLAELVLAAAVLAGRRELLVVLVVVSSFLLQTHVAVAPVVGATFALACLSAARRGPDETLHTWCRRVIPAVAVFAVLWSPAIAEQVTAPVGNLTALFRFFVHPPDHLLAHRVSETGPLVLERRGDLVASIVPGGAAKTGLRWRGVAEIAMVALAGWRARRRGDRVGVAFAVIALVAVVASFVATAGIVDRLWDYLLDWLLAVGAFGWLAVLVCSLPGWTNAPEADRDRKNARASPVSALGWSVIAVVSLVESVGALRSRPFVTAEGIASSALCSGAKTLAVELAATQATRPLFVIETHGVWPDVAGVLLALHERGVAFAVNQPWPHMFGPLHAPAGREDRVLHCGSPSAWQRRGAPRIVARVAGGSGTLLFFE